VEADWLLLAPLGVLSEAYHLMVASAGAMLAHAFEPHGESLPSSGAGDSAYGFTGEWTDGTGLVHLRARYHASYLNQWTQPDPIVPDPFIPVDWSRYAYVRNNPINQTEPAGLCIRGDAAGLDVELELYHRFNWRVRWSYYSDPWTSEELRTMRDAGEAIALWLNAHGGNGEGRIRADFGPATFHHAGFLVEHLVERHHVEGDDIYLVRGAITNVAVIHEMGHILDNLHSPGLAGSIRGGGPSDLMVVEHLDGQLGSDMSTAAVA
jgi:RHS repeat-associated protein